MLVVPIFKLQGYVNKNKFNKLFLKICYAFVWFFKLHITTSTG